jgi:alkylated DNA nucleotide flippase Atl1
MAKPKAKKREALPRGYQERTGDLPPSWSDVVGEILEGKVTDYREKVKVQGQPRARDVMHVQTAEGETVAVWVSAGLVGRVSKKDKGSSIFLMRLHDRPATKKGQNPMKVYRVGVK